jgi:hypothetical protein
MHDKAKLWIMILKNQPVGFCLRKQRHRSGTSPGYMESCKVKRAGKAVVNEHQGRLKAALRRTLFARMLYTHFILDEGIDSIKGRVIL